MSEWINHAGGKRPVHLTDIVQVKFRDHDSVIGGMKSDTGCAGDWAWFHDGSDDDIVAYRIIAPSEPHEPPSSQAPGS